MHTLRTDKSISGAFDVGWIVLLINIALCIWNAQSGNAEIYKYKKNGVVYYTNQPPSNTASEKLRVSPPAPQVNTRRTLRRAQPQSQTTPYLTIINKVADAYQIHPELIKAVIKIESNYNDRAVSPKGAQGLMQLMPATAERFGVSDSFDPEENITGGVKFLRYLFNEFGEKNLELVLAGYNAGEQAVRKYGNKIPPYSETRQYVKKVKAIYLARLDYRSTKAPSVYKYVNKDGVMTFTNIPRVN